MIRTEIIPNVIDGRPSGSHNRILLLGLLVAVSMVVSLITLGQLPKTSVTAMSYGNIPLSQHALSEHTGEKWNASRIAEYFDRGGCTPKEYYCTADDFRVSYCELNGNKSIGLVIGMTVQKIVTGFMADTNYWRNRCSR